MNETVQRQQYITRTLNSFLHRACFKTSFIRCFITVVFLFFCSWIPAEEYLFAALKQHQIM